MPGVDVRIIGDGLHVLPGTASSEMVSVPEGSVSMSGALREGGMFKAVDVLVYPAAFFEVPAVPSVACRLRLHISWKLPS
jgi:hypothetical protein